MIVVREGKYLLNKDSPIGHKLQSTRVKTTIGLNAGQASKYHSVLWHE